MNEVTLHHNEVTGEITDNTGMIVGNLIGKLGSFTPTSKPTVSPADLVELANAGFTADELLEMKKEGLL
tara:strand:+ start:681 stop:887 length:207 start_codon:yes stop_codon:yes gene_type:complete